MDDNNRWEVWMGIALAIIQDGSSQAELATNLGWNPAKMSRIARGEQQPKIRDLEAIASAQNRPLAWYFHGPVRPGPDSLKGLYRDSEMAIFNQPLPLAAGF